MCQECKRSYPDWLTPRDIWMRVIGEYNGMLCPTCFLIKAYFKIPNHRIFYFLPITNKEEWKVYTTKYRFKQKKSPLKD